MRFKSDRDLLDACFEGNRGAMEEFIRKFSKLVYYSIHQSFKVKGFSPDPDEVDDLYGDVFLSLFERDFARLKKFEGRNDCSLASWIRLIAARRTVDYFRDCSKRRMNIANLDETKGLSPLSAISSAESPEDVLLDGERMELASEIIPNLPTDDIVFLTLYYERELPPEEIADILGVSVGTVYSKKHRIQEKLRRMLEEK